MISFLKNHYKYKTNNQKSNLKNICRLFFGANRQKGVSLIIVLFIMIIILSVTLSISTILYSELKVIRNIGNSIVSFYVADSGVEKVLYYDRQVLPLNHSTTACTIETAEVDCAAFSDYVCDGGYCATHMARGLCSIFDTINNDNYCSPTGAATNNSVYCTGGTALSSTDTACDPITCEDCIINFGTNFDSDRLYSVKATIEPSSPTTNYYLDVQSGGAYKGAKRRIEIYNTYE